MTHHRARAPVAAMLLMLAGLAAAQTPPPSTRGQLLYDNHCIACHTEKIHWRNRGLVTDWPSLKSQVRRFQAAANLAWSDEDIEDVANHLNDTLYRLPRTTAQLAVAAATR